jgi:hypothetical protein
MYKEVLVIDHNADDAMNIMGYKAQGLPQYLEKR